MTVCKKRYSLMLVGGLVYYVLYVLFCLKMNYGAWWFNTPALLVVGMLWAIYDEKILKFLKKYYYLCVFAAFAIFAIVFVLLTKASGMTDFPIKSIISALFFVIFLLLGLLKFKIGNPILDYLGGISFELYLCHEIFLILFKKVLVIENDLIYALTAIVCSILFAQLFAFLNKFILSYYKKLVFCNN
jgi:membrane-bound acyltransferase YfiQ involved in biofilm formation